ncbi:MAG: DUF6152 family protein [Pseudohongiellaceae bacterium]
MIHRAHRASFLLAITLAVTSAPVHSHHPVQSQYSLDQEYTIEGLLTRVEFGSPHSFLHVLVTDENGDEGNIRVEWGSAMSLGRLYSIDRSAVQTGQRIRVTGFLSRNREDFMIWPLSIYTEFDLEYDRRACNAIERSGQRCHVLTDSPPLWPLLPLLEDR